MGPGGRGRLNRYAADGRLLASYRIPGQRSPSNDAIAAVGDTLILCLDGGLHAMSIDAPPGSTPRPLKIDAEHLSLSSHGGWVAASKGPVVFLVNAAGVKKPLITLQHEPWQVEIGPGAAVYAVQEGKVYRAAADAPGGLAYVGTAPGDRVQFLDRFCMAPDGQARFADLTRRGSPTPASSWAATQVRSSATSMSKAKSSILAAWRSWGRTCSRFRATTASCT